MLLLSSQISLSFSSLVCDGDKQRTIFLSLPACQARPSLVDLRGIFSNQSEEVVQVIPDYVTMDRCGGTCYDPSHTCYPTVKTVTKVQVMMVLARWPHGEHETLCSEVEVENHDECECGCRVQPDQCLPGLQYFHKQSCRCICSDFKARSSCLVSGHVWDPDTCQCQCPAHSWQLCSTGYMFDYVSSCSCVLINNTASKNFLTAFFILIASFTVFVIGGFLMFRYNRGPFKVKLEEPPRKRSIFMSQISKSEFEKMNLKASLGTKDLPTISEFDKRKNASFKSQDTITEDV